MRDDKTIQTVSIIGAGVMGRGIAIANVRAGIRVLISDVNNNSAIDATNQILKSEHALGRQRGSMPNQHDRPLISVAVDDAKIASADLIIETVSENIVTKTALLARIEPFLDFQAIIATNSSSIPIARLASSLKDPRRFCGLHFCHPVSQRRLVEVVSSGLTDAHVVDRACRYATTIGMAPIVVRDGPGFLLNRILAPYFNEALELLLNGTSIEALDQAALEFGMPVGPLEHLDEFGIDVVLAVGRTLYLAFPDRIVPSELLIALYKAGYRGQKSGQGLYASEADTRQLIPAVQQLICERQRGHQCLASDEIVRRLFLPMLREATFTLEERLVESPEIVDRALRDGLGMTDLFHGLFTWGQKASR